MNETPLDSTHSPGSARSVRRRGAGALVATAAGKLRDATAGSLITLGITPNTVTVAGLVLTALAAICLLTGAGHAPPWDVRRAPTPTSWWPLSGAVVLTVAFAADLLDGAMARLGGLTTRFGALLDSTLDRFSDLFIFLGCAIHFSLAGNVTYVTLSVTAAANAVLISYIKARAENLVDDCRVGYWQRGERCGLFLAAAYAGHIPAALWILSTLPIFTVVRRLTHAHRLMTQARHWEPSGWVRHLMPWRQPRGSAGYYVCTGLTLAFVVAAPPLWPFLYGASDPLRVLLGCLTVP
jgi:CDP-diacylglycerol--glycerol-3-phosphate 3-phosphatidyltransferase